MTGLLVVEKDCDFAMYSFTPMHYHPESGAGMLHSLIWTQRLWDASILMSAPDSGCSITRPIQPELMLL